ncbi:hypothetical protein ISN45_At01g003680 [Arabidopsis thaliana x Arabidopsis arenosa]|uniref:Uncharacterized protein n=2 Tax=Arabidopsis TaxID=3701 RepID=A0A8T2CC14_ARASU|nr:hypothetical protein ISN44_As06g003570 [Arabidopsis suecica]KAG7645061.1 hypothetical protein ISN45_At01g003680 [Arabidopsis thaliana x Arabidopsis arenosa]
MCIYMCMYAKCNKKNASVAIDVKRAGPGVSYSRDVACNDWNN